MPAFIAVYSINLLLQLESENDRARSYSILKKKKMPWLLIVGKPGTAIK